jgi:hypothetical protein
MFERLQGFFFYLDDDTRPVLPSSTPDDEAHHGEHQNQDHREPEGCGDAQLGQLVRLLIGLVLVDDGAPLLAGVGPLPAGRGGRTGEDPGVAGGRVEGAVIVHRRRVRRRRLGVARRALHVVRRRPLRGLGRQRRRRRRQARHVGLRRRALHRPERSSSCCLLESYSYAKRNGSFLWSVSGGSRTEGFSDHTTC